MTTRTHLDSLIDRLGLAEYKAELLSRADHALRLYLAAMPDDKIPIGSSKAGGDPDLPAGAEWPMRDGVPLTFIAQFQLREIASAYPITPVPQTGMLSLFYDTANQPWGRHRSDRSGWQVLKYADTARLTRVSAPVEFKAREPLASCLVTMADDWTLPGSWEDFLEERADVAAYDPEAELELAALEYGGPRPLHKLFGSPDLLQGDVLFECELASEGIEDRQDPRALDARSAGAMWKLLLQLDSDKVLGTAWGDLGRLYVCARNNDLKIGDLSRAWCILQCH